MSDECDPRHYGPQNGPVSVGSRFRYIEINGKTAYIDCGDDASLEDIHAGPFTVDAWVRFIGCLDVFTAIVGKLGGWDFGAYCGDEDVYLYLYTDYTVQESFEIALPGLPLDEWHHVTGFFDQGITEMCYLAYDGVWVAGTVGLDAQGVLVSDTGWDLVMGSLGGLNNFTGDIQWLRISAGDRFGVGVDFDPPAMCAPPAVDGTAIELWEMDEGTGALTAARVLSPENDGAMTGCTWHRCE